MDMISITGIKDGMAARGVLWMKIYEDGSKNRCP